MLWNHVVLLPIPEKEKVWTIVVFYKITFYSQRGINVFSFNNGNGIIYDDLDNNTYYYLNADNGSVVINKFF